METINSYNVTVCESRIDNILRFVHSVTRYADGRTSISSQIHKGDPQVGDAGEDQNTFRFNCYKREGGLTAQERPLVANRLMEDYATLTTSTAPPAN